MSRSQIGILLVGHGSHLSPDSATPIHSLARRIGEVAGEEIREVRVAFWKEEPELRRALELMESREVFVIPIFTSAGYFTEQVVPRELRLAGPLTLREGRRIRYTSPIGLHPGMARIALERAHEAAQQSPEEIAQTTLVIVGHGTNLHPDSEGTTQLLVERLQGEGYKQVLPAFLDQRPQLDEVLSAIKGQVVVVPFFISEGWHAGTTIPQDLGEFDLAYARAIGTHPLMAEIVCEMVAGLVVGGGDLLGTGSGNGSALPPLPVSKAREDFVASLREQDVAPFRLLQVGLRRIKGESTFEIRHIEDWDLPAEGLRILGGRAEWILLGTRTSSGAHRPLRTAPDLDRGWRFITDDADQVWAFLDSLYPGALLHIDQGKRGELNVVSFKEIASRQTGIHARVGELTEDAVEELVQKVCSPSSCLRIPIWHTTKSAGPAEGMGRAVGVETVRTGAGEDGVWIYNLPCPEPCSLFITAAAKRVAAKG